MKKEAYLKLFGLDKQARQGNVIGPLAGALIGGWRGSHIVGKMHKDPGKLLRALYILAGATGGGLIGNSIQNAVQGTSGNLPFISVEDQPVLDQNLILGRKLGIGQPDEKRP